MKIETKNDRIIIEGVSFNPLEISKFTVKKRSNYGIKSFGIIMLVSVFFAFFTTVIGGNIAFLVLNIYYLSMKKVVCSIGDINGQETVYESSWLHTGFLGRFLGSFDKEMNEVCQVENSIMNKSVYF